MMLSRSRVGVFMKLGSLVLVVSLLSAAAVQAQAPEPTPEQKAAREAVRQACSADMQSLCADKKGHEAMTCLRSNSDKVSSGCKDAMAKLHPPSPKPQ
jgi:hypothetical protein